MSQRATQDRSRRRFLAGAGLVVSPLLSAAAQPPRGKPSSSPPQGRAGLFNARDFGAVGDGAHDDTAAIQAALDAAGTGTGGRVDLPAGVYLVRTLILRSRVHLAGAGIEATILKLRDGTNDDLLRTHDFAALKGTNATSGPFNWSVRDLTLDGNRARNSAGHGLRIYGWGYVLDNIRVRQCALAGIDSEWSTEDPPETPGGMATPGDSMEAQLVNLKVHNCGGGGILFRGPHDSQFLNCIVYGTRTYGIHLESGPRFSATGCQVMNTHVWGRHLYGIKVDAGYITLVNCMAEWASAAQLHLNDSDATVTAGRFFGSTKERHVGIEIGSPERIVYGTQIDARMADLAGGALKFTNEGGSGKIKALIYQKSGKAYTGRPARGTLLELLVNGIETGSETWLPRGALGWNGGTPIVRHLSGTSPWSPSTVSPGAAVWTEVAVAGASVGDTVAVGFSRPVPAGALLTGAVTAPGIISVTLLNATGKPFRPGGGVVRADCWVH
ncbi:MAG: hypothetical protein NVSMB9_07610 [Isosphaeraceae bacterium]